jgi:hypothetical protein
MSGNGYWLTNITCADEFESVLAVKNFGKETATVCFGRTWTLSVPLQNIDDDTIILFEIRSGINGAVCGWSYITSFHDPTGLCQNMDLYQLFQGECPIPVAGSAPGRKVSLPTLAPCTSESLPVCKFDYFIS